MNKVKTTIRTLLKKNLGTTKIIKPMEQRTPKAKKKKNI